MRTAVLFSMFTGKYADGFVVRQLPALPDPRMLVAFPAPHHRRVGSPTSVDVLDARPRPVRQLDRRVTAWCSAGTPNPGQTIGWLGDRHARRQLHEATVAYGMFAWNVEPYLRVLRGRALSTLPLVVHAGGSDVTRATQAGVARDRMLAVADRASVVLCGSRFLRQTLVAVGIGEDHTQVHSVGIPVEAIPCREHADTDGPIVVTTASRLAGVKGVDRTIRAFARAAAGPIPMRLDLIGDGPRRPALEALVTELGIGDHVRFIGHVPQEAVWAHFARSDVYLQHNVRTPQGAVEALGGSILEASAARLPVVVTDSGGTGEAVIDGTTGYLVEEGDVAAMAERLAVLAADPELRDRLGCAGREFVVREHDLAVQNERLGAIVRSLDGSA